MASILVVDDNKTDRDLLETLLQYGGHKVVQTGDATEAMELARSCNPDLAVLDLLMPEIDGFKLAKQINDAHLGIRVISYSALDLDARATRLAASCGISEALAKPAEPAEILRTVTKALAIPLETHGYEAQGQESAADDYSAVLASTATRLQEQLTRLELPRTAADEDADTDPLTRVLARPAFLRRVAAGLRDSEGDKEPPVLALLSLGRFRGINESLGLEAGDECLRRVADVIRRHLAPQDRAGRTSGDEFGVFLRGRSRREVNALVDRMKRSICNFLSETNGGLRPTVSIGTAFGGGDCTADDLVVKAELARWHARRAGDDQCVTFTGEMPSGMLRTLMACLGLGPDDSSGFHLVGQPIVDLVTGETEMYELLLRLHTPDGTVLPPQELVVLAEYYGLVERIDRWVLSAALRFLEQPAWLDGAGISVNVSARTLSDVHFFADFVKRLNAISTDPGQLIIELTETAQLLDLSAAKTNVELLRASGVRFALDDFGTGFSSMTYAREFHADFLKLGSEFVATLPGNLVAVRVGRSIVDLARALGTRTIAEHVADVETYVAVRRLGVDYGQGYLWGEPVPLTPSRLLAA